MRIPFLLLLLLLSRFATAQSAGDERWLFGPLRFGMSTEAARAATPGTEWLVLAGAKNSNSAYEIWAAQVLELGGFRYDIKVGSRYGGSHHWEILSTAAATNAAACESRTAALIAELERRFGAFDIPAPAIGTEEVVKAGKLSKMKTDAATANLRGIPRDHALKNDAARYYVRARHARAADDDLDIMVLANYESAREHQCDIEARLDGQTPPPDGLNAPYDPARVIARPTISYRNRSLRDLGVPAQPLEFLVPCNLQASNGRVGSCINGPANESIDPYRKLASSWALKYRFTISGTDAEDQTMFAVEIPVTMAASDARDVDLEHGPILELKQLKVVRGNHADPDDYFPHDPKLRNMAADIAVRCKVQEDGSVICGLKPGTSSPAEAFTMGAIRLAENLEVEASLRDGSSAVDGLIERRIQFKSQPSSP